MPSRLSSPKNQRHTRMAPPHWLQIVARNQLLSRVAGLVAPRWFRNIWGSAKRHDCLANQVNTKPMLSNSSFQIATQKRLKASS